MGRPLAANVQQMWCHLLLDALSNWWAFLFDRRVTTKGSRGHPQGFGSHGWWGIQEGWVLFGKDVVEWVKKQHIKYSKLWDQINSLFRKAAPKGTGLGVEKTKVSLSKASSGLGSSKCKSTILSKRSFSPAQESQKKKKKRAPPTLRRWEQHLICCQSHTHDPQCPASTLVKGKDKLLTSKPLARFHFCTSQFPPQS